MQTVFFVCFTVTLALLGLALWSGVTRRRRLHFVFAPAMIVALVVTIGFTEALVRRRSFPAHELRIHLLFAQTAAALLVPVVVTGLLTARSPSWRRTHRVFVALFVLLSVIATGTGIWVWSLSQPK